MSYTAHTYEGAPGKVTIGGVTFLSQGPIREEINIATNAYNIETSGVPEPIVTGVSASITFKPDGRLTLARMQLLFAAVKQTNVPLGGLLWSSGGCVIHNINGRKRTYAKAWIVPTFSLNLTTQDTVISSLTIMCAKPNSSTALYADTTLDYDGETFDYSQVLRPNPTLAWGTAPWDSFKAQTGVQISLNANLQAVTDDEVGMVNQRLTGWAITANAVVRGPTVAQVQAALGAATLTPGSALATKADLTMTTSNLLVTLKNAAMSAAPLSHSAADQTQQAVTFVVTPSLTTGVFNDAFSITDNN